MYGVWEPSEPRTGAQTPARILPTQDARPPGLSLETSQFVFRPSALLSCPSLGPEREEAA